MAASRLENPNVGDTVITSTGSAADYYSNSKQGVKVQDNTTTVPTEIAPKQYSGPKAPEEAPAAPASFSSQSLTPGEQARLESPPASTTTSTVSDYGGTDGYRGVNPNTPAVNGSDSDAGREGRGNTPNESLEDSAAAAPKGDTNYGNEGRGNTPNETLAQSAAKASGADVITYTESPNILHNYASYTYALSWHLLSPDDYKKTIDNQRYEPSSVLVASAGRYGDTMPRNPEFTDDFYFDKLDITTIIGLSAQSKNSNAVTINFTIIEPYGVTLFNRLIVAGKNINAKNFTGMPYLIQIDFFGYDDDGISSKIEGHSKFIPISLTGIKMKLSTKGAEYEVGAVLFNHQAFSETVGTTPIRIEVTASTVGEFFLANTSTDNNDDSGDSKKVKDRLAVDEALSKQIQDNQATAREKAKGLEREPGPWSQDELAVRKAKNDAIEKELNELKTKNEILRDQMSAPLGVNSYTGAFNTWLKNLKDPQKGEKIQAPDSIHFELHPAIADATFPPPGKITPDSKMFPLPDRDGKNNQNGLNVSLDGTKTIMSINQGTSVIEAISLAIRNSSFITDQVTDSTLRNTSSPEELAQKEKKALTWFKIIPRIELTTFDNVRNCYGKKITYGVYPYTVHCTTHNAVPSAGPKGYVKDYQYMFTGKNRDVLQLDMNFDTLYYVALSTSATNSEALSGAQDAIGKEDPLQCRIETLDAIKDTSKECANGNPSLYAKKVPTVEPTGTLSSGIAINESVPNQVQNQILTTPGGDMISFDMKIIGDPDFIKQDDCFYKWRSAENLKASNYKTPNNSLVTDLTEIFMNLTFKTPGDYSDDGLATPGYAKYKSSIFSGIYKIITVANSFRGGKFEQTLKIIRHPYQPTQGIGGCGKKTDGERELTPGSATTGERTSTVDEYGDLDAAVGEQILTANNTGSLSDEEVEKILAEEYTTTTIGDVQLEDFSYDPYGVGSSETLHIDP